MKLFLLSKDVTASKFSNYNLTVSGYPEDVIFAWSRIILRIVPEYVGPTRDEL